MNNEFTRMQKLAGIITEGYTDAKRADNAHDLGKSGEENLYGAGVEKGEEIEKKKLTKEEAKKMIKDAILAEMSHDDDPRDELADPHNLPGGQYLDEAVNLNLSRAAKQIYSYIKKGGYDVSLHIHGSEKGIKNIMGKERGKGSYYVKLFNDKIEVMGAIGMPASPGDKHYDEQQQLIAKYRGEVKGLTDDILKAFPFLEVVSRGDIGVTFKVNEKLMKTGAITEASTEALGRMDGLVDQRALGMALKGVEGIIASLRVEDFDEEDIHDYLIYLVTTLDDSALMEGSDYDADKEQDDEEVPVPMDDEGKPLGEAKKDKEDEGEDEVEVEDEETIEEPAADEDMIDADMEGGVDMDAGSDEAKTAFDELTDAYRSAKELGDEKLIRQLANTITYFNKNIILK